MRWWMWSAIAVGAAVLGSLAIETICEARDRAMTAPGRMIDVGGRRLHLLCTGAETAGPQTVLPTVVIEQGAGSPSILWWPIQAQVAGFARVCTYDRAGYQWSDPAPLPRSMAARVADLHAVLHGGGVKGPYVLVAHSFGGPLIRLYTRTYPDEVAGLVLVDTTPDAVIFRPSYDAYVARFGWVVRAAGFCARFGVVRLAAAFLRTVPDGMTPEAFGMLKRFVAAPGFFRAMDDDAKALARVTGGYGSALGNRPVVVITHGERFPGPAAVLEEGWEEGQAGLAAQSSRGEIEVAVGCNHMIPSEAPALVVAAIRRVVEQVNAGLPPKPQAQAGDGTLPK